MLGNDRQCFECGHEHGDGDRCVSFYFEPDFFVRAAIDAGARRHSARRTCHRHASWPASLRG
jgi:hypothetical protein